MNKKSNCFEFNLKQKKHYKKWKEFIKNLNDKPKEKEKKEEKTFKDYFPVSTITKYYVNRLDYEPLLGA